VAQSTQQSVSGMKIFEISNLDDFPRPFCEFDNHPNSSSQEKSLFPRKKFWSIQANAIYQIPCWPSIWSSIKCAGKSLESLHLQADRETNMRFQSATINNKRQSFKQPFVIYCLFILKPEKWPTLFSEWRIASTSATTCDISTLRLTYVAVGTAFTYSDESLIDHYGKTNVLFGENLIDGEALVLEKRFSHFCVFAEWEHLCVFDMCLSGGC
jgi:hypothetical protein